MSSEYTSAIHSEYRTAVQFPADLVTFTKEILNGKLHFFVQRRFWVTLMKRLTP